ncbi:MAG: 4Fe-4S binding protein, partial [Eggerthellaceae bacterium]|nr:4Fe-4S binding protein [Eggerthellaceae bacterium]
ELSRAKCIVTGDIGCYTLGALPPLSALDTTVDMGASISIAHGFELALSESDHRPIVGVIGDSTFAHSGLTSLLNTAYNQGSGTVCILDNRTTGMTGHQGNPVNGKTLQGRVTRELDLENVVKALGVDDVKTVNPNDRDATRQAIKDATEAHDRLSVIVFRSPCVLLRDSFKPNDPYFVNGSCTGCGSCISLGCPAIAKSPVDGTASIDQAQCVGCGQCAQYCNFSAIEQTKGGR